MQGVCTLCAQQYKEVLRRVIMHFKITPGGKAQARGEGEGNAEPEHTTQKVALV